MFKNREQNILLILALMLCIFGNLFLGIWESLIFLNSQGDTLSYIEASKQLVLSGQIDPIRPLGISLINSIPFLFGFSNYWVIIVLVILQNIAWVLTILFFYKTLILLIPHKTSFYLGLALLFSFGYFLISSIILSEVWTILFLVVLINQLVKYHIHIKFHYLLAISSILILLTLIRPGFYYPAILFFVFILFRIIRKGIQWNSSYYLFFISLALLVLNNGLIYKNHGQFKPSYIDDVTIYTYLGAYGHTEIQNTSTARVQRERREEVKNLDYCSLNTLAKEDIRFQLAYHPGVITRYLVRDIFLNSTTGSTVPNSIMSHKKSESLFYPFLYWLSQYQNLLIVLLSIILPFYILLKRKMVDLFWIITTLLPWYITFTSGISYMQGDRFHIVFYPIVLLQIGFCYFLYSKKKIA